MVDRHDPGIIIFTNTGMIKTHRLLPIFQGSYVPYPYIRCLFRLTSPFTYSDTYRLLLRVRVADEDDDRVFEDERTDAAELFLFEELERTAADLLLLLVVLFTFPELRELLDELPKTEFKMLRAALFENIPPEKERDAADLELLRVTVGGVLLT